MELKTFKNRTPSKNASRRIVPARAALRLIVLLTAITAQVILRPQTAGGIAQFGPGTAGALKEIIYRDAGRNRLPEGWEIKSFQYTDYDALIFMQSKRGEKAAVRLAHPSLQSRQSVFLGESLNFKMEYLSKQSSGDAAAQAALALSKRIKSNDRAAIYNLPVMKTRETRPQRYFFDRLLAKSLVAGAVLCALLLLLNISSVIRFLTPVNRYSMIIVLLLAAASFLTSLQFSPQAPVHTNGHGIREIRSVIYPESPFAKEVNYGLVYPLTMRALARAEREIFTANMVMTALAVLAIYALAKALMFSELSALTAAFMFALSPAQIYISGSESPCPMFQLFAFSGLFLLLAAARTQKAALLICASMMIAFAASMNLLSALIAPAAAIIFLWAAPSSQDKPGKLNSSCVIGCALFVSAWAALHLTSISAERAGRGVDRFIAQGSFNFWGKENILLDPSITPPVLVAMALVGIVWLWVNRTKTALLLSLLYVVLIPASFTVKACRPDVLRYQSATQWVYLLAAAAAVAPVEHMFREKKIFKFLAIGAISLVYACQALYGAWQTFSYDEEAAEYRFIREATEKSPGVNNVAIPVIIDAGGKINNEFPDYFVQYRQAAAPLPADGSETLYLGLNCYRELSRKEISSGGIRDSCKTICPGRLEPISEKTLSITSKETGFWKRYFNFSSTRAKVGFYKCLPFGH